MSETSENSKADKVTAVEKSVKAKDARKVELGKRKKSKTTQRSRK